MKTNTNNSERIENSSTDTMNAVLVSEYGNPSVLECGDVTVSDPGPNQLRLAVEAAGLNYADIEQRRGKYPNSPDPPFVPGLEAAGYVDAVGENVDFQVGEPVVCIGCAGGGWAEYLTVDESRIMLLPENVDMVEAAGFPIQYFTAHNCLHEWGDLDANEFVLIHAAAGGVGSAAVQLASEAGATVIATASTREKLAFATALGADHTINYESENLAEALQSVTNDDGVDLVLDGVGGSAFSASVESLADGGRIVTFGLASGRPGTVATPRLFFENRAVIGYHYLHGLTHMPDRVLTARDPLSTLLEEGVLEVQIDETYSFDDADAAHERLESRQSKGKIVLRP